VVTHEHALPYSTIDSSFAQHLTREARRVARFDPRADVDDVFDMMDGYYVPVSGFNAEQPGPLVEIWEVPTYRTLPRPTTQRNVLSRALSQMAANAVNDGDQSAAAEALRAATGFDPNNEHALLVAARMHWDAGDTTKARRSLDDMLLRDSTSTRAMAGLAQVAADRGDRAGAIRWLEQVHRQRPRDVKAASQLAELYWQVGDHQRALTLKARNVELRPWLAQGYYDLGSVLLQVGSAERALPHLLRAIAIAPDSVTYYVRAAAAHEALGQLEQAEDLRQRAGRLP
jgi:tetratricopeptide (TPR) repeat protein